MNVLIVVTHLLGTGHLRRALTLANSFAAAGHGVTLASGGTPVAGLNVDAIEFVQLPPLKSDGTNFTTLLTADGTPADADYLAQRTLGLLKRLEEAPDVLITELFPFGRRVLSTEFITLLEKAKERPNPPKIFCSIRDILAPPSKPAKVERTEQVIEAFYDWVLVHSDEAAIPLEISWPVSNELRSKLRYTGFVTQPAPTPHPTLAGSGEVLVSAGGGAVGLPVFRTALEAAKLTPELTWRLLVGGTNPSPLCQELQGEAPPNVHVEAARSDFRQMLNHAVCSVSLAGYNTAMDLLQTGIPALLIPFDDGGEVEQSLRAKSIAALPGFDVLTTADVTPAVLADRVVQLATTERRSSYGVSMDGADETVRIAEKLVSRLR